MKTGVTSAASTIAVMQPYFLPYIGYFQLMASVDKFVILDDVNYINRGWINRNRLPDGDSTSWLTLPLLNASQNRQIREIDICPDDGWKQKMRRRIVSCYSHASESMSMLPLVDQWLDAAEGNLSSLLFRTLCDVKCQCGIETEIVRTSSIYPKGELRGQHRILDICEREGADVYVNPPGGKDLYDPGLFHAAGVDLMFLKPETQNLDVRFSGIDGPVLSILDLLMQNSLDSMQRAVHTFGFSCPVLSAQQNS